MRNNAIIVISLMQSNNIMKKGILFLILCISLLSVGEVASSSGSLNGRILLQVESRGEAWYVDPATEKRVYLGRPEDAFQVMREFGVGISEADFKAFSIKVPQSVYGKILLRVQSRGEAYYVNVDDGKLIYLGRPNDAFEAMRKYGLGISNANLMKIAVHEKVFSSADKIIVSGKDGFTASEWSKQFLGDSSSMELDRYYAYYYLSSNKGSLIEKEKLSGSYAVSKNNGADSIYFVGYLDFAKPAFKMLSFSGTAKIKLYIDGYEISDAMNEENLEYNFSAGRHKIEIVCSGAINTNVPVPPSYGSPEMGFEIMEKKTMISDEQLSLLMKSFEGAEIYYAGAYEPKTKGKDVRVSLKEGEKPVILVLSSYEPIQWNIAPENNDRLLLVVVASYKYPSDIKGVPANARAVYSDKIEYTYDYLPDCIWDDPISNCDVYNFGKLRYYFEKKLGLKISGFSGYYNPYYLIVPQTILDDSKYSEIDKIVSDAKNKLMAADPYLAEYAFGVD